MRDLLLLLLVVGGLGLHAQDSPALRPFDTIPAFDTDRDQADWLFDQLADDGAVVIRLSADARRIRAYEEAGHQTMADQLRSEIRAEHEERVDAFRTQFDYAPVYVIHADDHVAVRGGLRSGYLLNRDLEVDPAIEIVEDFVVFVDRGTAFMMQMDDPSNARAKGETSTPASQDALVVKDLKLRQIAPPFPGYVPVRFSNVAKTVRTLNERLHRRAP